MLNFVLKTLESKYTQIYLVILKLKADFSPGNRRHPHHLIAIKPWFGMYNIHTMYLVGFIMHTLYKLY